MVHVAWSVVLAPVNIPVQRTSAMIQPSFLHVPSMYILQQQANAALLHGNAWAALVITHTHDLKPSYHMTHMEVHAIYASSSRARMANA